MVNCVAYECRNFSMKKDPNLTFHRFPADPVKRNIWVQATKIPNLVPTPNDKLCSKHFEKHFFYKTEFKKRLLYKAVPTIFLEYPKNTQIKKVIKRKAPQGEPEPGPSTATNTESTLETSRKKLTEEEDASFYHSNQPTLYNLAETEVNNEIDDEIEIKYQPMTVSLDEIKEEIDIDDYSPSVTHQLKKRKTSHQPAYEVIGQTYAKWLTDKKDIKSKEPSSMPTILPSVTSTDSFLPNIIAPVEGSVTDIKPPTDINQLYSSLRSQQLNESSRTESDTQIHNPMEDVQIDEWSYFGNNIACQLRNLPLERALSCQQKIIEILTQERIDLVMKMKTEDTNTTTED